MRKYFDQQLNLLDQQVGDMTSYCIQSISIARTALVEHNPELSKETDELYAESKALRKDIEALCVKLLLQQQPVAKDLRHVSATLKMVTDLERISEQAADIGDIIKEMKYRDFKQEEIVVQMASNTMKMVNDCVKAYMQKDETLAESVIAFDDIVDDEFVEVKKELISFIASNPNDGEYALDLLRIAKYLEGMSDHAVNVSKWVKVIR